LQSNDQNKELIQQHNTSIRQELFGLTSQSIAIMLSGFSRKAINQAQTQIHVNRYRLNTHIEDKLKYHYVVHP